MPSLELKPPFRLQKLAPGTKSVFLAGSIEMGKAEPWQDHIATELKDENVVFYNPRRDDWDSSWKQDPTVGTPFEEQVTWELDHINKADIVVFYFDPKTTAPISLLEMGLALEGKKTLLVCCPDGYFRKGNVVVTVKRFNVEVLNSLPELINKLKAAI